MRAIACVLLAVLLSCALAAKKKMKLEQHKAPKPVKLNTDNLKSLPEILEGLQMSQYLPNLVKMGVTETRLLLRLSSMDFRLMEIDWEGITKEEVSKLKDAVASLVVAATVIEEPPRLDLTQRNKLTYGRVYLDNSVEAYEFTLASFGRPSLPLGKQQLVALPSMDGCEEVTSSTIDYSGKTLLVRRGNCTFLSKALNAKAMNAAGLVIVNTEDRLESPSSGLGVDKNVTNAVVEPLSDMFIVALANTSWAKITKAIEFQGAADTFVSFVPLKCTMGRSCGPVIDEEKALQAEVTWGHLRTRDAVSSEVHSFEFLTSNFGSQLPAEGHALNVVLSEDITACEPLAPNERYHGAAVVVNRGLCRFDVKAFHVQEAGARMMVIVEAADKPLQRVGGMTPEMGFVGIPSILVTAPAGEYISSVLADAAAHDSSRRLSVEFSPARDSSVADMWIDLSMTVLAEDAHSRLIQLEGLSQKYSQHASGGGMSSIEIVPWIHRRIDEITYAQRKSIDTDEL